MRLGYFGGTFDPPHLGHLAVAQAAAKAFSLDRVLLVPTGVQPLKSARPIASYADRFAMVSLLCQSDPRLSASDLERPKREPTPNYTVDTLQRLHASEPDAQLFVIVGADAFQSLLHWRSPELLLTLAEWIVVTRPSLTRLAMPPFTPDQQQRIHLLQSVDNPASATAIRAALTGAACAPHLDLSKMLLADIWQYIRQHHLYCG